MLWYHKIRISLPLWSSRSCACMKRSVITSQTPFWHSNWMIYVWYTNSKWHAPYFHMNPFYSLTRPFTGRPSVVPGVLWSSGGRFFLKVFLTNSLYFLHQIYIIWPLHHLPQGTLLRLAFQLLHLGRRHCPCEELGAGGWLLHLSVGPVSETP